MKCAARFEKLLHERRASETTRDMNDKELLEDIVSKYNGYKATAALKRWQIGPDGVNALLAVICGMCHEARQLVRMHLDFNKYEESGCLPTSLIYFSLVCFGGKWFAVHRRFRVFVKMCQHEAIMKPYFETNATS